MASTSLVHSDIALDDRPFIGVVAKRAYRLGPHGLEPADVAPSVAMEPSYEPAEGGDGALIADSDLLCFHKQLTDVLLHGSAHASTRVAAIDTGLQIGPARREIRVHGDSFLKVMADGSLVASACETFTQQRLGWHCAYGGRDAEAEQALGFSADGPNVSALDLETADTTRLGAISYPRNRIGRGFRIDMDRTRLDGLPLPCTSDPADPFTVDRMLASDPLDWADRPIAAGYAPVDSLMFPRIAHHRLWPEGYDRGRPLPELALGALLEQDLTAADSGPPLGQWDPRAANCAAPGLAVCRLLGNERVSLRNLHPRCALVEFDLPAERPRMLIEPPNTRTYELEPVLGTVLFEPDVDRVTLTWSAAMEVAAPFPTDLCKEMRHAAIWS